MHSFISTQRDHQLALHANHLIDYADRHRQFGDMLAATICEYEWTPVSSKPTSSRFLVPLDETRAHRQVTWLLATLTHSAHYPETRGILASWAAHRELPKSPIFGIVGLAVIGPTLGIIDSPKKKKRKMQLVIADDTYARLSKEELAALTTSASHRLLAKELQLAEGNFGALHPETAAWMMDGADIGLLRASSEEIDRLAELAKTEQLSFHRQASDGTQLVAFSPCVDAALVEEGETVRLR